jgi:hypothetical protein
MGVWTATNPSIMRKMYLYGHSFFPVITRQPSGNKQLFFCLQLIYLILQVLYFPLHSFQCLDEIIHI